MFDSTGNMLAAIAPGDSGLAILGAAIGCAGTIIGASLGIGFIGGRAADATARQPEAGGRIFAAMLIAASLIEGATFFALVICLLTVVWMS